MFYSFFLSYIYRNISLGGGGEEMKKDEGELGKGCGMWIRPVAGMMTAHRKMPVSIL
jgi:hypothetical protein